jgi:predicted nucleic acid-binding protein
MSDPIIDSAVLIDYLRGHAAAIAYLNTARATAPAFTHVVVVAELLEGARDQKELAGLRTFFSAFNILAPTETDALLSVDLLAGFRLSHGIGWPDCLIAATALRLGRAVVTTNVKHFSPIPNLQVVRPY